MDKMILTLLNKIDLCDIESYFSDAKLTKINLSPKNSSCTIYIEVKNYLPVDIVEKLDENVSLIDSSISNYQVIYNVTDKNEQDLIRYYPYLLKLLKNDLMITEIYKDSLMFENDRLLFSVSNLIEEEKIKNCMPKIEKFFFRFGYN